MKNLQNLRRRSLSLLLALVMCISVMQIPAFATDGSEPSSGSESSSSGTPSDTSSSNDTSSSSSAGTASGSDVASESKTDTGSHETSAGTDASDNSGAPESTTETDGNNEPASNNTETNEPADSSEDQNNSAPAASAPTGTTQQTETPVTQEETPKTEAQEKAPAQETGFVTVTPTDLVTDNQEKNENDNNDNDAWNQVVANLSANKRPMMMAAAPEQQDETQNTSENDTTEVTEPQSSLKDGVTVTVKPNEDENSQTVAVKPDGVPENATWDKDKNCWTWTEVTKEGGTTTPSAGDSEELPDLKDYTEETSGPEPKTDKDGKTYTETVVTYTSPDGNTIYKKTIKDYGKGENTELKEDPIESPITITTTTTNETTTTTVTPGTVTVEMSEVTNRVTEDGSTPITQDELDIKDATVTITKGDGDNYTANVKLGLSGTMLGDGTVKVTIAAGGKTFTTTLGELESDNSYTLTGINLGNLSGENGETISVTLTGEQIKTITQTTQPTTPELLGVTENTQKPNYVTIEFDKNGNAQKVEIKDDQKIQNVKDFLGAVEVTNDFAVYADTYDQSALNRTNHVDGNICVNTYNNTQNGAHISLHDPGQYGPANATSEEKVDITKDYVYNGFSYIGKFAEGSTVFVSCNVKETDDQGKFFGPTLVTKEGELENVTNQTNGSCEFVELDSTNFEDGKLTPEALAEHPKLSELSNAMKIDENLGKIAAAGAILNQVERSKPESMSTAEADKAKIKKVGELLEQGVFGSNDVVSVAISIETLTSDDWDWHNNNSGNQVPLLTNLINKNKNGTTIIINVNMNGVGDDGTVTISQSKMMNKVDAYDGNAANLIWNFGDYKGTINTSGTISGRVIGANATLNLYDIQAGNAVAQTVSHGGIGGGNGEIHMAVPGTTPTPTPTPTPDPGPTPATEKHQVSMNVDLTVKVDAGKTDTVTSGGDTKTEITSTTTNRYQPVEPVDPTPTPPSDDKPDGNTPDPGPGPGPGSKPDPEPPVDVPEPDVPLAPTPEPEPEPEPEPTLPDKPDDANTPNVPDIDIPDDDVPLSPNPNVPTLDIPDGNVPLASVPGDGLVEIEEEEVPLAEVPQTGDTFGAWALLAALSLCGVTALALPGKRKEG